MWRGAPILVAVAVAACGGSRSQPPGEHQKPSRLKLTRVVVTPAQLPQAAGSLGRGLVLGTDEKDGSTFVPLIGRDSTLAIGKIEITTRPVTGPLALPATSDPGWQQASWAGALAATGALGKDIGDLAIAVELTDPSAAPSSAAVAAGILASLTGATLVDGAALTGPVHPDGTVGTTDVVDLGLAYARLTGEALPAPVAVPAGQMRPDRTAESRFEAAYHPLRRKVAASWSRVIDLQTEGKVPPVVAAVARRADAAATGAEKLRRKGNLTGATFQIALAASLAEVAVRGLEIVDAAAGGRRTDALAMFDRVVAPPSATAAVFDLATGTHSTTLAGMLARLGTIDAALLAHARVQAARPALDAARAALTDRAAVDRSALADRVVPALEQAARASAMIELDSKPIALAVKSATVAPAPELIDAVTAPWQAAATATAQPLDPVAGARARALLGFAQATGSAATLRTRLDAQPVARALARLSLASQAYVDADARAALATGSAVALVTAAERRAREHARQARIAVGVIPVHARVRYQQGVAVRASDPALALELLWSSSVHSQLAVALARAR